MGRKRQTRKDLPARVYFKHNKFYFVDRENKWHNIGDDFHDAMIKYSDINSRESGIKTISHLIDKYIKTGLKELKPKTQKEYLKALTVLRSVFGEMLASEVTPGDIYKYLELRPRVSGNREKAVLSQVFKVALRLDLIAFNPCRQVQSNKEVARDREITDTEFLAVYKLASEPIQNAMDIALITGLRQADILKLTVTENWTSEGLKVKTGKTGKKILFERTPTLEAIVQRCIESQSKIHSIYLIRNTHGYPYSSSGFQSVWYKLMGKAVAQGIERFQFRDIRARAGTEDDREDFLGHADPSTYHKHYRRGTLNVVPIEPKILDSLINLRKK